MDPRPASALSSDYALVEEIFNSFKLLKQRFGITYAAIGGLSVLPWPVFHHAPADKLVEDFPIFCLVILLTRRSASCGRELSARPGKAR